MRNTIIAVCLILVGGPVIAQELSAEAAIEQRQAAYKALKAEVKNLKSAMKSDPAAVKAAAEQIVANVSKLPDAFPPGSDEGDTRAKKKIWDKWDDFEERLNSLVANADALLAASETEDPKAVKQSFKALSKDCKGCHMRYRQVL
jgi:cytochrome c556